MVSLVGVIIAWLNVAGTVSDSRDMLMIVANVGARMSTLAFTSEIGSERNMFVFVVHIVTSEITPSVVIQENALTEQDGSQCTWSALTVSTGLLASWLRMSNTFFVKCSRKPSAICAVPDT